MILSSIRTTIFYVLLYSITPIMFTVFLPTLPMSKNVSLWVAHTWLNFTNFLLRYILGLKLEVRGKEYLPKEGSYIIAAKHQSAYETLQLHFVIHDPAIVLKKELLEIPVWGKFLGKLDMIGIDRSDRDTAMRSIIDGVQRMKEQNRPIIIFPQGTRVQPEKSSKEKPYKGGIVRMYDNSDLPVIPMALNSGLFWKRGRFCIKPGTVVFQFLPPIAPGLPKEEFIQTLEHQLEEHSIRLMQDAKNTYAHLKNEPITDYV